MIQVGRTYKAHNGSDVKIVIGSGNQFTGDNGVWYDSDGNTERGVDLSLVVPKETYISPALRTNNERELFQCLKEVIEDLQLRAKIHETLTGEERVVNLSNGRYQKAKRLLAKFGEST